MQGATSPMEVKRTRPPPCHGTSWIGGRIGQSCLIRSSADEYRKLFDYALIPALRLSQTVPSFHRKMRLPKALRSAPALSARQDRRLFWSKNGGRMPAYIDGPASVSSGSGLMKRGARRPSYHADRIQSGGPIWEAQSNGTKPHRRMFFACGALLHEQSSPQLIPQGRISP